MGRSTIFRWTTAGSTSDSRRMFRFWELSNAGADLDVPLHLLLQAVGAGGVSKSHDVRAWQAKRLWAFRIPQFAFGTTDWDAYLKSVPDVPRHNPRNSPPELPVLVEPRVAGRSLVGLLNIKVEFPVPVRGFFEHIEPTEGAPTPASTDAPYWRVMQSHHFPRREHDDTHLCDWTLHEYAFDKGFIRRAISWQEMLCALLQGKIDPERPTVCVGSHIKWEWANKYPLLTHRDPDNWTLSWVSHETTLERINVIDA